MSVTACDTVLVDGMLRPVTEVHEFYADQAYVTVGDHVSWLPTTDLFPMRQCTFRHGRRRFLLFGQPIHRCEWAVTGSSDLCLLHGGGFDYQQWATYDENGDADGWTGPLAAGVAEVWRWRTSMVTFTPESTTVYLFSHAATPLANPMDPYLLMETGVAGPDDIETAWRRALGAFSTHH